MSTRTAINTPEPARRRKGLNTSHPLARVARAYCRQQHPDTAIRKIGTVACRGCWQHVIDADLEAAAEFGLDPQPPQHDPELVDEIAVERAVSGDTSVRLTSAERREVARLRTNRGSKFAQPNHLPNRTPWERAFGQWAAKRTAIDAGWFE